MPTSKTEAPMTRDRFLIEFRFAIDGYVLGKWSIYKAGMQISEALAKYYDEEGPL